ncbi:YdcH family protein [Aquisediminimonas profunda]|uniref:YdcH family protein n=1 Tax=Aquisediminimonas profunda TaxID=1550733 RepID=UPI001C63441B|nr:DUF465 domain-containing protein [Aquisediminimonas profunda]
MSHRTHELHDEFPDAIEKIRELKANDAHFTRLADRYDGVNQVIHRIEIGADAASDERTEILKKQRLSLLDDLAGIINARG